MAGRMPGLRDVSSADRRSSTGSASVSGSEHRRSPGLRRHAVRRPWFRNVGVPVPGSGLADVCSVLHGRAPYGPDGSRILVLHLPRWLGGLLTLRFLRLSGRLVDLRLLCLSRGLGTSRLPVGSGVLCGLATPFGGVGRCARPAGSSPGQAGRLSLPGRVRWRLTRAGRSRCGPVLMLDAGSGGVRPAASGRSAGSTPVRPLVGPLSGDGASMGGCAMLCGSAARLMAVARCALAMLCARRLSAGLRGRAGPVLPPAGGTGVGRV